MRIGPRRLSGRPAAPARECWYRRSASMTMNVPMGRSTRVIGGRVRGVGYSRSIDSLRSYCQKWCLTIDSSGGLVDVGHFDSIVEFHPSNHLGQIIESS